jgi:hypothetical protein
MIEYTWKITDLKTKDIDGKPSAVVQTYWQKIGTDENGNQGTFAGATPFTVDPTDDSGPFKPFNELTEADIIAWIQTVVVGNYEEHVNGKIAEQIEQKITPVTDAKLPWATEETTSGPASAPAPV